MWKPEHRQAAKRHDLRYPSDLTDAEWALIGPMIPPARRGGRPRDVNVREVLNAILYVLSTGCQLLRSARRHVVSRIMVRWTIILCLLVPIYLMLIALFTYSEPISKMRFTKGFECTERAKQVFSNECPFLGTDEISTAGYEEDTLWTTRSVLAVKSLIVVMWLACFAALSTVLGSFAMFQMGQKN